MIILKCFKLRLFSLVAAIVMSAGFAHAGIALANGSNTITLSNYSAFSGCQLFSGVVWGSVQSGAYVEYVVTASAASKYNLVVNYATPMANAALDVSVNGTIQGSVALPSNGTWGASIDASPLSLNLAAGDNRIRISNKNGDAYNIYGLKLNFVSLASTAVTPSSSTVVAVNNNKVETMNGVSVTNSTLSKSSVALNELFTAGVNLTANTSLSNLIIDIRIVNSAGTVVSKKTFQPSSLSPGVITSLNFTTSLATAGTYSVQVGVWSSSWFTYLYVTRDNVNVSSSSVVTSPPPVVSPTPTPTPTATATPTVGNFYIHPRANSGYCVDIATTNNSDHVYIWQCTAGNQNENFAFTSTSTITVHGKCLDAYTGLYGDPLTIYDCHGGNNQKFTYDKTTAQLRAINGLCVELVGGQVYNNNFLNLYTCDSSKASQKFDLEAFSSTSTTPTPTPTTTPTTPTGGTYPFAGQKLFASIYSRPAQYVNSGYCPVQMQKMAAQPGSVWLSGTLADMDRDMPQYLSQAAGQGAMPVFVIYNIPGRDCGSYSAGGSATYAEYSSFVEKIARYIGGTKSAVLIEPDGLANAASGSCWGATGAADRIQLIKNAVLTLRTYAPNTAIYLDAGGPAWVSATEMAGILNNAGVASANGFSLNVSGYSSTDLVKSYGTTISSMTGNKHFVIDTSRNGNGGTTPYQWCNPPNQAVGPVPQGFSSGLVDAYLWVNVAGSSDGYCNGYPGAGTYVPQLACDMAYRAGW